MALIPSWVMQCDTMLCPSKQGWGRMENSAASSSLPVTSFRMRPQTGRVAVPVQKAENFWQSSVYFCTKRAQRSVSPGQSLSWFAGEVPPFGLLIMTCPSLNQTIHLRLTSNGVIRQ